MKLPAKLGKVPFAALGPYFYVMTRESADDGRHVGGPDTEVLQMARYDYRCSDCGNVFEVVHSMSEHPAITCPKCGAPCERVFKPALISFKGTGFYNTDQRGGGSSTSATSGGCGGCSGGDCSSCSK